MGVVDLLIFVNTVYCVKKIRILGRTTLVTPCCICPVYMFVTYISQCDCKFNDRFLKRQDH
jgi:hypothetical protein